MIAVMPIFGADKTIPAGIKGGLSILITFILAPFVKVNIGFHPIGLIPIIISMAGEIFIGIMIGFIGRLIFAGIQFGGEMIGFEMGFSVANIIDPITNNQVSLLSHFQYLIAMLIFMIVNAHHIFLSAIAESFVKIEPLQFHLSAQAIETLCLFSKDIFIIAVKISAPVVSVLIFTNISLGVVARTVPQMNVFIMGFPLQIALGLIFLGLSAPIFINYSVSLFNNFAKQIHQIMLLM